MCRLLFLFSFVFVCFYSLAQSTHVETKRTMDYGDFQSYGEEVNGVKHGTWIDSTAAGVVYTRSEFEHGIPVGLWVAYYPDGKVRKEISYENGAVKRWKFWLRNRQDKKFIEFISDATFTEYELQLLTEFDNALFDQETVVVKSTDPYYVVFQTPEGRHKALIDLYKQITGFLQKSKYNGTSSVEFNKNKGVSRFVNGALMEKEFYKGGKLKKMHRYKNGVAYEEVTYAPGNRIKSTKPLN